MTRTTIALFLALAWLAPATAAPDLIARMAAVNPTLHSYTATMHAHVALHTFPFLAADLVGTVYHREPGSTKVVIESGLPAIAGQFGKLFAHVPSPSQWRDQYDVTLVSDDGTHAAFRLVPHKGGNIARIDAVVDDGTATVSSMRWTYANGGYAEMNNSYGRVGENLLVTSQKGHVEEPGYTADISSTLDNYHINVTIPDSTFQQ